MGVGERCVNKKEGWIEGCKSGEVFLLRSGVR